MFPKYSINFTPLFCHPIGKAVLVVLLGLTGLLILMLITHYRLYGSLPPVYFFIAPIIILLLTGYNEQVLVEENYAILKKNYFWFNISNFKMTGISLLLNDKYSTFIGHANNVQKTSNIVMREQKAEVEILLVSKLSKIKIIK